MWEAKVESTHRKGKFVIEVRTPSQGMAPPKRQCEDLKEGGRNQVDCLGICFLNGHLREPSDQGILPVC